MIPLMAAAKKLEVGHHLLRKWINAGAPHELRPNPCGGMKKIFCDPREIYAWVRSEQFAGNLDEKYLQDRILAEQARDCLLSIKKSLGLTTTQVSELAEIPRNTVHRMLYYDTYRMKTFPKTVVTRIELLRAWVEPRRKRGQKPTLEQTRHALRRCEGVRNRAHKYLGVEYHVLHDLIEEYGLNEHVNYKYAARSNRKKVG